MDLTQSIEPRSDQVNSDDLISGPITVTIREVSKGSAEQPVDVHLVEYPKRAYRPSKSMRRIMVAAWGRDASVYAGRRLTLYRNPDIKFGGTVVGGIEISHLSDISKPLNVALTATRGKKRNFTVEPLPENVNTSTGEIARDWQAEIDAADKETLRALWYEAPEEYHPIITKKAQEQSESPPD